MSAIMAACILKNPISDGVVKVDDGICVKLGSRAHHSVELLEETLSWAKHCWKEHSVGPSIETVMLDLQASKMEMEERSEILSMLPPLEGKDVIELGAGIGQFTGDLANSAGHLLATDFMEDLIKEVVLTEALQKSCVIVFYHLMHDC